MKRDDARRLDHATLEAMRERAVRSVQEGESPELLARVIASKNLKQNRDCPGRAGNFSRLNLKFFLDSGILFRFKDS
jgi:hypothetical protein